MATSAPKAVPKAAPKTAQVTAIKGGEEEAPVVKKRSKKKLFLILFVLLLLIGGGGGAAFVFMGKSAAPALGPDGKPLPAPVKHEPEKPPIFVVLEPFTVNLQPETGGDQFLQVALTLQVIDQPQVEQLKLFMPQVRSRLLLLLSSKKASEISTPDGKKKLAAEIIAQMQQPFSAHGKPQTVNDVFFTSFVIQ
jgi:flagellar FliL protein